jgi:hypothetical protein
MQIILKNKSGHNQRIAKATLPNKIRHSVQQKTVSAHTLIHTVCTLLNTASSAVPQIPRKDVVIEPWIVQ